MKKYIPLIILTAMLSIQATAENNFKQMILGKWKATGSKCNESGDCGVIETTDFFLTFTADGKVTMQDGNNPGSSVTYRIENDVLTLSRSSTSVDNMVLKILKISETEMLWYYQSGDDIVKLTRVTDPDEKDNRTPDRATEEKYKQLIVGRWKVTGMDCNESGECRQDITGDMWIEFDGKGTVRIRQWDGTLLDNSSYILENGVVTINPGADEAVLTIVLLDEKNLIMKDGKNEIVKFTKIIVIDTEIK